MKQYKRTFAHPLLELMSTDSIKLAMKRILYERGPAIDNEIHSIKKELSPFHWPDKEDVTHTQWIRIVTLECRWEGLLSRRRSLITELDMYESEAMRRFWAHNPPGYGKSRANEILLGGRDEKPWVPSPGYHHGE